MPETDDEVGELARTMDGMLQALDEAHSEREQSLERQREFVADASHELRTPLTSIHANLELLQAAEVGSQDDKHAVDSALSSTKRMSGLVSDLLLLARADAGRRAATKDLDLAAIAAGALEEVQPIAGDRRMESHLDGPLPLEGNPDELHRLIRNLLENAVRHTPDQTTVELTARRDGDEALLEVARRRTGHPGRHGGSGLRPLRPRRWTCGHRRWRRQRPRARDRESGRGVARRLGLPPAAAPTAGPVSRSACRSSRCRRHFRARATAPPRRFSQRSRTRHRFAIGRDTSPRCETPHATARPAEARLSVWPKRRPRWSPLPRPPGASF